MNSFYCSIQPQKSKSHTVLNPKVWKAAKIGQLFLTKSRLPLIALSVGALQFWHTPTAFRGYSVRWIILIPCLFRAPSPSVYDFFTPSASPIMFSSVFVVKGCPDQRSSPTSLHLLLKCLCHAKTCVRDVTFSP